MLARSPITQAAAPSAQILTFPADRVRPPPVKRAQVSAAMADLSRAVAAYAESVRTQQAAIAEFLAATEAMRSVATSITDRNGTLQQTITRILSEARLLRLNTKG